MGNIRKIIEGNQKAFESFYYETHQRLYTFIFSKTHDKDLSQEILQKAYIILWENRSKIKPEQHFFEAYLFKVIRVELVKNYKRKISEQQANLIFEQQRTLNNEKDPIIIKGIAANEIKISDILSKLPEKQRSVFELIKLQGLSYLEAAQELKVSKRTVESNLREAILRLKKIV
ncbi:RNA polymerase sigma factor [Tenacibaculum sp. M341]|uniref:RNA polymerase sigma factor n=1 Tax=Tenacibaculum sp. M341 TaxID=2530339 RepID=UPI00104D9B5D|nr:RNA polymerase sigma factor [Tenacibaculum sp. M341]TCI91365.1 RNA polymerase sigma factor [Tenacibaculum sp. M341]